MDRTQTAQPIRVGIIGAGGIARFHAQALRKLPVTFMLLQPGSNHPHVWTDVARMLGLNTLAAAGASQGRRMLHLCPLPQDIADRAIVSFTNPGETVLDPFAGIGSVPYRAVMKGRKGIGIELSTEYFCEAAHYCKAAEDRLAMPMLFDVIEEEQTA